MIPAHPRPALSPGWKAAIVGAAAFAFTCKILLALNTYGTNDVYAWERFARWSQMFGADIYRADPAFNHPPSMIHFLGAVTWLSKVTGIFFPFWMRLPAILADAASLWLVSRIFARRLDEPAIRWGLLLMAISPVLILVSGFHGNTDPVVMFFVLLSVWLTQDESRDWASGAAFGMAMCVKVMPLIVLPVLFFCRARVRRRVIFLAAAVAVIAAGWSPYLFHNTAEIMIRIFRYQSIYGHWGLSWAAEQQAFFRPEWHDAFQHYGGYVVLALITAWAWRQNRSRHPQSVYAQTGLALFFFLVLTNGFGVQYLAWLVPWTVGLAILPVAFFSAASGAFLYLTYNYWAGGFPWFLADGNYVGDYTPHLDYFLVVSWLSVALLAWAGWRVRRAALPHLYAQLAASVILILAVIYPMWRQLRVDGRHYPASVDRDALIPIRASEDSFLSEALYSMGRYPAAVVAARTAIAMDPGQLDAWNDLARACIQLGKWDEALNAAYSALRIKPDDEMANANLALSQSHH